MSNYGGSTGFIVWELMIGRTNTRFHWGQVPDAPATVEPATPFQGTIYPDGHPWSVDEAKKLKGSSFDQLPLFKVDYYTGDFEQLKKSSVTQVIDFDLGDEPGTGSPDASAGIPNDHFSIRWIGRFSPSEDGNYTLYANGDNITMIKIAKNLNPNSKYWKLF